MYRYSSDMPRSIEELVDLLRLEAIEVGLYRGQQPDTSLQRVFGGQVLGQALAAAYRTVPNDRAVHSLHAYFLRPGDPAAPIIYDVERLRDGRSFAVRRTAARQHGRPIFFLSASFQVDEPGPDHQDAAPPMTDPQSHPSLGEHLKSMSLQFGVDVDEEWAALDVRHAGASYPGADLRDPEHPAVARVWMRTAGRLPDDPVLHRCVLAYMSDLTLLGASLVPHTGQSGQGKVQRASLDHAMWFHRPFRADAWLLYDQVSPSASGARGLSIGRIFDEQGTLVATAVQEGLVRLRMP
jgi:acyl-CoA thioesterase-2